MTENPYHYAVVIGIKYYPSITNLESALTDAYVIRALRRVNETVRQQCSNSPLDWPKTRLYFYLSGHGIAPGGGEAALLMANWDDDALAENIPCGMYLRKYEECQYFHEVVVFADCCRNWKPAEYFGPGFGSPWNNLGRVHTFLGFATQPGEAAYEPSDGTNADDARSYFTRALLEGLRGAACDRENGAITSETLAHYMIQRVPELTKKKKYPQMPQMPVDLSQLITFRSPLVGPVDRPKRRVTISFTTGFIGGVDLYRGLELKARYDTNAGPWTIMLEDGLYEARKGGAADGSGFNNNGLFKVIGDLNADL